MKDSHLQLAENSWFNDDILGMNYILTARDALYGYMNCMKCLLSKVYARSYKFILQVQLSWLVRFNVYI